MITSYSKEALKHELEHNAIHNILIKPINPSLLLDTILSAFGKGAIQQPLHTTTRLFHKDAMNALKGASILLVEDNIINQEMALEILEKAGLHVDVANNGYEALLKVRSKEYDGVLMDCQMPIIDGFEATRLIREEERFKDLPILAMTANAMAGDKERCLQCGMNDHIAKPIDVAKLFMTMAKYIFPKHTTPSSQDVTLTEKTAVLLPTFTTLNTKDALARVNHDAAIFFKLLNRFAHKESDVVQRIEILIASHHYDDAIREAHTLKGLAGTIGANALMESASTLEQKLKATPHNVQDDLETLQKLLFGICEEIEQKRSQIEALLPIKELSAHELQTLKEQCHTLIALLKDLDPDAGDLFDILLPQLRAVIEEKELKTLAKLIHDFHYDEAILIFEKYPSLLE